MKINIVAIITLFASLTITAHESDKAFFKINQNQTEVIISAEFPWTLRNAILKFSPKLINSNKQIDFDNALYNYLKINLILFDTDNNQLELKKIEPIKNLFHTHQNDYSLTYSGQNITRIRNTIMFNINPSQTNYHVINSTSENFETHNRQHEINMKSSYLSGRNILWSIVLISIVIFFIKRVNLKNKT